MISIYALFPLLTAIGLLLWENFTLRRRNSELWALLKETANVNGTVLSNLRKANLLLAPFLQAERT